MSKSRGLLKKIIYKLFGEHFYQRAYVRGKISDIRSGKNLEEEAQLLKHFVRTDSTVLDIGANYGHYTVVLAKLARKGTVYAFEPVPFTYGVLEKITAHFQLSQAKLFHAAVSNKSGMVKMNVPLLDFGAPNTGVAHIGDSDEHSQVVEVKTVKPDELELSGRVDFIKMDIEGHEPMAFEGMQELIRRHQPVILIEFSHNCLKRAGFDPVSFANDLRKNYGYRFAQKKGDTLQKVTDEIPADGYYFLLPESKMNVFKTVVSV